MQTLKVTSNADLVFVGSGGAQITMRNGDTFLVDSETAQKLLSFRIRSGGWGQPEMNVDFVTADGEEPTIDVSEHISFFIGE